MTESKPHIFLKSVYGAITIMILSCFLIFRGTKTDKEFYKASGKITYLEKHFGQLPNRNFGKYRYLKIDASEQIFEIYVGKDLGDFKPSLERLDHLKAGDNIKVYFDLDPSETEDINRLVQFVYKNDVPYFIRGSVDKYIGIMLLSFGILMLIVFSILKYMGKIDL